MSFNLSSNSNWGSKLSNAESEFFFNNFLGKILKLNWVLISLILLLNLIGFFMLYSASGGSLFPWLAKQLVFVLMFFPIMLLIGIIDVRFWYKTAYLYYFIALALLIVVSVTGHNAMGATRWFKIAGFAVQPSEIMKICLVFVLSRYFYNIDGEDIGKIRNLIYPLFLILLPTLLVFEQPDLGTAIIIAMSGIVILFIAGVRIWKFVLVGISALIAIPFLWLFVLYDYQKQRVLNFINPDNDPLGTGYNIIQSKIAIGSGGFFGKGYLDGTQGQLDFLPEKQTDFIFTMLAEELGFMGSVFTIFIYSLIIYLGYKIANRTDHQFGRLLVIGITNVLFLHMFINIGMVMGLLPVVGAPLPLISYGGTITATMMIAFGLVLSVDLHRDVERLNS